MRWPHGAGETGIAVKTTRGGLHAQASPPATLERRGAEAAVERLADVTGVANDIAVREPRGGIPDDPRAAVAALKAELPFVWRTSHHW
jgi:hypothetical protein